ncbi:hypothetical protein MKK75_31965 [Methylobacterium sp. J-030]|uniref:hypothetical protein n=1 Tax=Methylobacterium sp. J-030 TaxID=2836627 RepID=UPI001FBBB948|nr:hypothetical protein [Methylobacterium sp. J-030]
MRLPPSLDGFDEVGQQTIDYIEVVRHFGILIVPVIAFAALVVEADHAQAVHDVDEAVLETVPGRRNRFRDPPDNQLDKIPLTESHAATDEKFRLHERTIG